MLNSLRFAGKLFWREWWRGEWLIIFFALVISVSAFTTLNFFTDRIKTNMAYQSATLLGGNIAISSPDPISKEWIIGLIYFLLKKDVKNSKQ